MPPLAKKAARHGRGRRATPRAPVDPNDFCTNNLDGYDDLPFNPVNIDVVTGFGRGACRVVARPGLDPPDLKDRIEVEIIGADVVPRVSFDAKRLVDVHQACGLNTLISICSETSGISRSDIVLVTFSNGARTPLDINPYRGSDVDARLHEAFEQYKAGDGSKVSESGREVWWSNKRNELDACVQKRSITDLIQAIDPTAVPTLFSFKSNKIFVMEEDSHLWAKPEWSDTCFDKTDKSLRFAIKAPPKLRGSKLARLELECRKVGDDDFYIIDQRSGGKVLGEPHAWDLTFTNAQNFYLTLNTRTLRSCGLVLEGSTMYELRARYVFNVERIGERESVWSNKTGQTKASPDSCRAVVVTVGDKRSHDELDADGAEEVQEEAQEAAEADVEVEATQMEEAAVVTCGGAQQNTAPPPQSREPVRVSEVREAGLDLDQLTLLVWLRKTGPCRPDFSKFFGVLVANGVTSLEDLGLCVEEELENVIELPIPRKHLLKVIKKELQQAQPASSSAVICPITREPPKKPVRAADNEIYERWAIETWLREHDTSPMHKTQLANKNLTPV